MNFEFDLWGWYSGQSEEPGLRTTQVAPANTSLTEVVGELRANWTGVQWVELPYEVPPAPVAPVAAPRHISVGAFFDRFGAAKWGILADATPTVAAVVKDASVRKYIDLDSPDLPAGIALLQQAGHDVDVQAIITAPVQEGERP